jgi:transposase-like protein
MEEGHQKSKRLSYTAEFKREVIWCAEDKGNRKAAAIFGVDESNVRLWRKHKAAMSRCEASRKKFTGPKEGRFLETDDAVLMFFQERRKTSYDLLCEEVIKKARSLNIPRSRFKGSKGQAIRCMCWMGLALRRRTTICQKIP